MPVQGWYVFVQKSRQIRSTCAVKSRSEAQWLSLAAKYITAVLQLAYEGLEVSSGLHLRQWLILGWFTSLGSG